jgi:predicted ATPase/DNA-binding SARP family transcriptional activator
MPVRIDLFCGLAVYRGGSTIDRFQTYKTGALLAYLAYFQERPHSRESLASLLWPDAPPDAGRNRLTQALVWLRPRLESKSALRGSVLLADRNRIGLNPEGVITDVGLYVETLQAAPPNASPERQIELLHHATTLYRGELLTGYYEDWVTAERQRLSAAFVTALRRLTCLHEEKRAYESALDYARRALAADPQIEESHCDVIRLLALSGQSATAMRQYHEMEQILADTLGETPSAAARALIEQIRQNAPQSVSLHPGLGRTESRVPTPLTRFFGRDALLSEVRQRLASGQDRLVTLVGTGGCGKTRLAIEVAQRLRGDYAGAIWFVPLGDIHDSHLIPNAIGDVLGTVGHSVLSIKERIVGQLARRPSLLILDNLEHQLEEAAPLVRELLERVPTLTILATSRQSLGIAGERQVPVPPLPVPSGSLLPLAAAQKPPDRDTLMRIESIQLFVDRAQAVDPSFTVSDQNAATIAQLCDRLEGIPLAVELCAAWAQTLTPAEMLERLAHPLDLLVSLQRETTPRHQSLRATLEYSYAQLSPALQQFFRRLSVFRNGWTREAAEAVCRDAAGDSDIDETLTLLTALRQRSLITAEQVNGAMRYRMLETLREFAAEKQALADEMPRDRWHATYFLERAESSEPHLTGPEQVRHIDLLDSEYDNLRAALAWAIANRDSEIGLRLANALTSFWDARGHLGEGQQWLTRVLALPQIAGKSDYPTENTAPEALRHRARALTAYGDLARNQGNSPGVDAAMHEAIHLWREIGDEAGLSSALQILATITYSRDDSVTARQYLEEGLLLARRLNDEALIARALHNLGNIALAHQGWDEARSYYTESLVRYNTVGNRNRAAHILNNLGLVARYRGEYADALAHLQAAREISRELSDHSGMALVAMNLATTHRMLGEYAAARSSLREGARLAVEAGERRLFPWCARELGHLTCAEGDHRNGVRLLAAAESQRHSLGISFKPADPDELEKTAAQARTALGEQGFAAAWAVGSGLPRTRALAEALQISDPESLHGLWEALEP